MSQFNPSEEIIEHGLALIRKARPVPLSPEQEQKVRESLKHLDSTLQTLRAFDLLEGSEPAFTFRPAARPKG